MLDIIEGCIAYNYWNVQAETTMAIYVLECKHDNEEE